MSAEYETKTEGGRTRPAHDVLMEEILGRPLKKNEVVHHLNGEKRDNRPENLQVMDRGEHTRMHREGVSPNAETLEKLRRAKAGKINANRKVEKDVVAEIAEGLIRGKTIADLSRETNVRAHTIQAIRDGKRYRDCLPHLPDSAFPLQPKREGKRSPSTQRILTPPEVGKIRIALLEGESVRSIARRAGVSESTVRAIREGETYQDLPWPTEIARYQQKRDLRDLARTLLEAPMSREEDGRKALTADYRLVPDAVALLMLKTVRRALAGDAELAMLLLLLGGYEEEVQKAFLEESVLLKTLFTDR